MKLKHHQAKVAKLREEFSRTYTGPLGSEMVTAWLRYLSANGYEPYKP